MENSKYLIDKNFTNNKYKNQILNKDSQKSEYDRMEIIDNNDNIVKISDKTHNINKMDIMENFKNPSIKNQIQINNDDDSLEIDQDELDKIIQYNELNKNAHNKICNNNICHNNIPLDVIKISNRMDIQEFQSDLMIDNNSLKVENKNNRNKYKYETERNFFINMSDNLKKMTIDDFDMNFNIANNYYENFPESIDGYFFVVKFYRNINNSTIFCISCTEKNFYFNFINKKNPIGLNNSTTKIGKIINFYSYLLNPYFFFLFLLICRF